MSESNSFYRLVFTVRRDIDEIKYLVDIPTDCDVKDIWAVAGYYAKDNSECDTRLKELKNIYDEGGVKAVVDERVIYK